MRNYTNTTSQQARQFVANAALDAAEVTRRRAESVARIRAAHEARQNRRAKRQSLEAAYNLATVKTGTDYEPHAPPVGYDAIQQAYTAKALYKATAAYVVSNAAFTAQARRAARRLGVTLTNHAEMKAQLGCLCIYA